MTIDLPILPSFKSKNKKKVDSSIPKWTVLSLCIITVLIIVTITKVILPFLFFALLLAFIWSQATKPVAQFERDLKPSSKQLNIFHQKQADNNNSRDRIKNKKERRVA